jgi:hypothetical protein
MNLNFIFIDDLPQFSNYSNYPPLVAELNSEYPSSIDDDSSIGKDD